MFCSPAAAARVPHVQPGSRRPPPSVPPPTCGEHRTALIWPATAPLLQFIKHQLDKRRAGQPADGVTPPEGGLRPAAMHPAGGAAGMRRRMRWPRAAPPALHAAEASPASHAAAAEPGSDKGSAPSFHARPADGAAGGGSPVGCPDVTDEEFGAKGSREAAGVLRDPAHARSKRLSYLAIVSWGCVSWLLACRY